MLRTEEGEVSEAEKEWKNWAVESRGRWGTWLAKGEVLPADKIHLGLLQRIADALEKLAGIDPPGAPPRESAEQSARRYRLLRTANRAFNRLDDAARVPSRLRAGVRKAVREHLRWHCPDYEKTDSDGGADLVADALDFAAIDWEACSCGRKSLAWLREVFPRRHSPA